MLICSPALTASSRAARWVAALQRQQQCDAKADLAQALLRIQPAPARHPPAQLDLVGEMDTTVLQEIRQRLRGQRIEALRSRIEPLLAGRAGAEVWLFGSLRYQ